MLSNRNTEILKRIAGGFFVIAFLMAIVLYKGVGREYISLYTAKIIFLVAGALGLFLNLLTFQSGKHSPVFNFLYWSGSIVLFTGLVFLQFRLPYGFYIIVAGLVVLGVSFILPASLIEKKDSGNDLIDSI
jgi:drug/metabolite transporter (DMT)-like permease